MKKILLVWSGEKSKYPRTPYGLLEIASYIRKYRYDPKILDLRIDERIEDVSDFLVIGLSSFTGENLKSGISFCKQIKKTNPSIPIIFGGHHASSVPDQLIKEDYVDAIIVGEGQKTFLKLIEDIESGDFKPGIYQQDIINQEELDLPAFDLIDMNKYLDGTDDFCYSPSTGCNRRCSFCYCEYFHNRFWRGKKPEKVIEEIKQIIEKYRPKKIKFIGDNFFNNKNWAFEILNKLKALNIIWSGTCRADYLASYTTEDMNIIKESGCWLLQVGVESGSQKILDIIQKDITPDQSIKAVSKCVEFGIIPLVSFIIGIPGETKKDLNLSIDLYNKIEDIGGSINGVFIYCPYAKTKLYETALELGFKPPTTTEGWSDTQLRRNRLPWHGKLGPELETITKLSRFKFFIQHIKTFSRASIRKRTGLPYPIIWIGLIPFRISCSVRWKLRFFKYGYEWNLFNWILSKFTEVY